MPANFGKSVPISNAVPTIAELMPRDNGPWVVENKTRCAHGKYITGTPLLQGRAMHGDTQGALARYPSDLRPEPRDDAR